MSGASPDLTLAILTYDRPEGLAATLRSCLGQRNRLGLSIEIVVVDNHPSGSGRPVVEATAAGSPWPIRYVQDLTRNMATLRNRGFSEARGRWLAVIDDDETAADDWTDALVGALQATGADIAVGPRFALFEAGAPPPYDPEGRQFVRDLNLPDLAEIELTTASGRPRYGLGTGNSIFDMGRCFPEGEGVMREAFGDAGGEDAELFVRLHRQGRRIVWAAQAKVTETVSRNRTEIPYRLIRTRRETQHYVSIYVDGARWPRLARAELFLKGLMQAAVGGMLTLVTLEGRSDSRLRWRLLLEHGLGKLSWRRPVGYIDETPTLV
ncbi:glycosyltransferase family 2 protein [Brevundimonas sp.]|uniref:glycosyltransferase family 2 protein n=1 Tax=Brevundimonas sp. TaxID=1871086 RepID=UPI00289C34BF|nr:glycosyltransferase family 2 protein [Brevundimonas sp.]